MGDRSNLPKVDRTNGFDDGRDYMRVKKNKLAKQNDSIREALRNRNSTIKSDLFKNISINVNGRTQPTADELKRLILLNGGDYHPYYRYQTTKFMIATNLSTARIKTLRPDDRVVRPEWITDSIQAKCLLPYQDYQLFMEEPRGKTGTLSTIVIDHRNQQSTSSTLESHAKGGGSKAGEATDVKSRDIREMFSKCTSASSKRKLEEPETVFNLNDEDEDTVIYAGESKTSSQTNEKEPKPKLKSKKTLTMFDFVIKCAKSQNNFPVQKSTDKGTTKVANICGLTDIDQIIGLLNDWVGCPEGVRDEDVTCVIRYFNSLLFDEEEYNKLYVIVDALYQRVLQHDELEWIRIYNKLIETIKKNLNKNSEASENLNQLLTFIDDISSNSNDNEVINL